MPPGVKKGRAGPAGGEGDVAGLLSGSLLPHVRHDRRDDHRKAADGDQVGVRAGGGEVIEAPWRVNSGIEVLNRTEEPGQRADVAVACERAVTPGTAEAR